MSVVVVFNLQINTIFILKCKIIFLYLAARPQPGRVCDAGKRHGGDHQAAALPDRKRAARNAQRRGGYRDGCCGNGRLSRVPASRFR